MVVQLVIPFEWYDASWDGVAPNSYMLAAAAIDADQLTFLAFLVYAILPILVVLRPVVMRLLCCFQFFSYNCQITSFPEIPQLLVELSCVMDWK